MANFRASALSPSPSRSALLRYSKNTYAMPLRHVVGPYVIYFATCCAYTLGVDHDSFDILIFGIDIAQRLEDIVNSEAVDVNVFTLPAA
jgi:hypothetical protein